jgi:hypothetical protein
MNLESLFDQPEHRRFWLLSKALESAPLDEAIELARAADQFIGGAPSRFRRPVSQPEINLDREHRDLSADTVATDADAETEVETTSPEVSAPPADLGPIDGHNWSDGEARGASDPGLSALASTDDVVRYLRQRDDVVVAAGEGIFLLNGRFRLTADELLARANRMRGRDGKPPFQIAPSWLARSTADVAVAA